MMFDISEIKELSGDAVNGGMDMPLKHPITGEETGAVWKVRSYESEGYKAIERRLRTKGMKALRKNKANAEMADEGTIELISSLVVDWSGMTNGDQTVLPFSKAELVALLKLPIVGANFIEQVDAFADDNVAFFKASVKSYPMPLDTK